MPPHWLGSPADIRPATMSCAPFTPPVVPSSFRTASASTLASPRKPPSALLSPRRPLTRRPMPPKRPPPLSPPPHTPPQWLAPPPSSALPTIVIGPPTSRPMPRAPHSGMRYGSMSRLHKDAMRSRWRICRFGRMARRKAQVMPGSPCNRPCLRARTGTSGLTGMKTVCAVDRAARLMNSSSPACRRTFGTKALRRRTPG